jgi:hypothetical protein
MVTERDEMKMRTAKKWSFQVRAFPLTGLMMLFSLIVPTVSGTAGGTTIVASPEATCQFTRAVNDSLGLNATMWFPYLVNDSWMWEHNGTLTWAVEPNLAFWTYLWEELERLTAELIPEVPLRKIEWSLPVEAPLEWGPNLPGGFIYDYNNGSYYTTLSVYPEVNYPPDRPAAVENLTFVLTDQWESMQHARLLAPEYWIATIIWHSERVSDGKWLTIADRLSTRLNATWYVKSCVFTKDAISDANWPFETVFLGLLVLVGLGSKRRLSTRKRVS